MIIEQGGLEGLFLIFLLLFGGASSFQGLLLDFDIEKGAWTVFSASSF